MMTHDENIHKSKIFMLRLRQGLISLGPILITISLGLAEGYSAILLPQLKEDPSWNPDRELSSWIASITTLPMSVGCLLGGWLMEAIGRRMLHLVTCIPNIAGWLIIAFCGQSVPMLLAGRFITGMCVGVLSPVLMVYVAETSDPVFRGLLLPSVTLALNLGITIAHIMGTFLDWKLIALLACIYPSACFILMLFVPESPTYLIKRGRTAEAQEAFLWFRGYSDEAKTELNILIAKQQQEASLPKKSLIEYMQVFKMPEFYKPLFVLVIFFSTMQLSGANPITFYTVDILEEILKGSAINSYHSMLIMDGVRVIASILGCFSQQYMKRRKLMCFSCSGTILSLLTLSIYLFLAENSMQAGQDLPWIVVTALVLYIFFVNIGLLPLPYSMTGEVFAQATRGLGSAIVTLLNMVLMFVIVKITPWLFVMLRTGGVFLLFTICCFSGMLALIIYLPETKDMPLHEIEDYFKGTKKGDKGSKT